MARPGEKEARLASSARVGLHVGDEMGVVTLSDGGAMVIFALPSQ